MTDLLNRSMRHWQLNTLIIVMILALYARSCATAGINQTKPKTNFLKSARAELFTEIGATRNGASPTTPSGVPTNVAYDTRATTVFPASVPTNVSTGTPTKTGVSTGLPTKTVVPTSVPTSGSTGTPTTTGVPTASIRGLRYIIAAGFFSVALVVAAGIFGMRRYQAKILSRQLSFSTHGPVVIGDTSDKKLNIARIEKSRKGDF